MKRLAGVLAVLGLLSGCASVSQEPEQLSLVAVLGVDGRNSITLEAVCGKDSQGCVLKGRAVALTFDRARCELVWSGEGKELSLSGVSHLVVGSDVDLEEILYSVIRDEDLGASVMVWAAPFGAKQILDNCADPAADLELLREKDVPAPSVAQALAQLSTRGEVMLPCLKEVEGRLREGEGCLWRKEG